MKNMATTNKTNSKENIVTVGMRISSEFSWDILVVVVLVGITLMLFVVVVVTAAVVVVVAELVAGSINIFVAMKSTLPVIVFSRVIDNETSNVAVEDALVNVLLSVENVILSVEKVDEVSGKFTIDVEDVK